jgi:hypothetical protein
LKAGITWPAVIGSGTSSGSGPAAATPPYTPIVEATPTRGTPQSQAACSTLSRLPIAVLAPLTGSVAPGGHGTEPAR